MNPFTQSTEATALAIQRHAEAAARRPHGTLIPTGPWPAPRPKAVAPPAGHKTTVHHIIAVLRAHPDGLTAAEIIKLTDARCRVSGLLKARLARGDVVLERRQGAPAVYRLKER